MRYSLCDLEPEREREKETQTAAESRKLLFARSKLQRRQRRSERVFDTAEIQQRPMAPQQAR